LRSSLLTSHDRILTLAQIWPLKDKPFDFCLLGDSMPPESLSVNFQFYRTSASGSVKENQKDIKETKEATFPHTPAKNSHPLGTPSTTPTASHKQTKKQRTSLNTPSSEQKGQVILYRLFQKKLLTD